MKSYKKDKYCNKIDKYKEIRKQQQQWLIEEDEENQEEEVDCKHFNIYKQVDKRCENKAKNLKRKRNQNKKIEIEKQNKKQHEWKEELQTHSRAKKNQIGGENGEIDIQQRKKFKYSSKKEKRTHTRTQAYTHMYVSPMAYVCMSVCACVLVFFFIVTEIKRNH